MSALKRLELPRVLRDIAISPVILFLLAAVLILPSITSWERVTFSLAGITMNVRVAAYFVVAAGAGLAALPVIVRTRKRPMWLKFMLAMIAWFTFTALVARQSPVEWLPTIVRLVLYFGAAMTFYAVARPLEDRAQIRAVSRLLPLVILLAVVIPALAGTLEFALGSAPIVNEVPRVSGSMPDHPVAYSLMLVLGALATMGLAFLGGRKAGGVLRWIIIAALAALVFTTFTRLSILLLVAAAAMLAALLPAPRRTRLMRVLGAVAVGAAVVLLALPTFEARFTYGTPISTVIARPEPGESAPVPSPSAGQQEEPGQPTASGEPLWDIEVDGSVAYRIMLTKRGLAYLAESPLVGQGPGSFDRLFEDDSGRSRVAAHNDLLSVAVETGLPGLALFLLTMAALVWAMLPRRSTGVAEADALIVTALVALVAVNVGATIHNPMYFVEIQLPLWILVGTALGLQEKARSMTPGPIDTIAGA